MDTLQKDPPRRLPVGDRGEDRLSISAVSAKIKEALKMFGVELDPARYAVVHRASQILGGASRSDLEQLLREYQERCPDRLLGDLVELSRKPTPTLAALRWLQDRVAASAAGT